MYKGTFAELEKHVKIVPWKGVCLVIAQTWSNLSIGLGPTDQEPDHCYVDDDVIFANWDEYHSLPLVVNLKGKTLVALEASDAACVDYHRWEINEFHVCWNTTTE